ncbi:hypothetical protein LTR06_011208 [Exophiala xenobiotica]|nr:hypothetical protein LTR06_011208 [Exophiala xenobiotica]
MPISISAVASHSYIFLGATAFVAFAALVAWNIISIRGPPTPKGLRRPPSPPGARFFSGHAHLWSGRVTNNPSQSQLIKWAREYGEIYEFRLGVERWVIISSPEAVKEIFDKNGALTGSRPAFRVMNILSGGIPDAIHAQPYGKKWRSLRAIAHRCLGIKSAEAIKPTSSLESHRYLHDILRDPDNFLDHVKRYTSSVIMYSI